jgi:3-phosphoshikimate 1-carboxyvinyltransferase
MGLKSDSKNGKLPITINKSTLCGIHYESPVASAQVKSAVILAGLGAKGKTSIAEPILSRNHTEKMLDGLGVKVSIDGLTTAVSNLMSPLTPFKLSVPGDPSTAAFFAAAAALVSHSDIQLNCILINPTRIGVFRALGSMGINVKYLEQWEEAGETIGNLNISYQPMKGITITKDEVPGLIDELPVIAVLATQANGKTIVRGAEELRIKECDRIHALCVNLNKMGAEIEELDDGFIINGPTPLNGAEIETFHDHRIAMAFTIAGLVSEGDVVLDHPECVSISYPEFYKELDRLQS